MSYTVTLRCGCRVYVSCHPTTGLAHTRVIEERPSTCEVRSHDVGARIPTWELLAYEPDDPSVLSRTSRDARKTVEHARS